MKRARVVAVVVAAAWVMAPVSAVGVAQLFSYSGSDFSVNSTDGKAIDACDRESDFHQVRADWQRTGSSTVQSTINDGGQNTCERAYLTTVVYKHRIVENIPLSRDDYGPWKYPS